MNQNRRIQIIKNVNPCIGFGWFMSDVKYKRNAKTNSTVMPLFRSYV